jgi:hypothetical protein
MGGFADMFSFLGCLAASLAEFVEGNFGQQPCAVVFDELDSEVGMSHTRKDPEARRTIRRQLLEKNTGKNYWHIGKIAKAMGKDFSEASYQSQNHTDCHRYWLASCLALASEVHVAMASDASRIGGKDRLTSADLGRLASEVHVGMV